VLSTLAEMAGRSRRSSLNRRGPSVRCQITSGVHAPPSRLMQADMGQPGTGGFTFFLRTFTGIRPLSDPPPGNRPDT